MQAIVFQDILSDINKGLTGELKLTLNGRTLIRRFVPRDRLILLGCGHVSQALCRMASMLDFEMIAVDDRPSFANSTLFPSADRIICDSFENAIGMIGIRESDYVCVLTRGHQWDHACVGTILRGEHMPYYLGLIGSHRRVAGLRDCLADEGIAADKIALLHAPIGLSIGAVTPAEIAVSICAELIQHRHAKRSDPSDNTLIHTNTDIDTLEYLANASETRAMLLVLSSTGSTPVKSGAIMAVNALGKGYGTIGGGCSEAEAMTAARRVIGTKGRRILDFDMTNAVAADNGMVCGGRMTVLIEDVTD
jgi:xanthine dehydrogenase accessory factor